MKGKYVRLIHELEPVFDEKSEILILGSFPSVKSRETGFYYGHPQNRFWRVLEQLYDSALLTTVEEKKQFLKEHHIALWDVIEQCDIIGSSDSSIKNVIPTAIDQILQETQIKKIYVNGKTAERLYRKYTEKITKISAIVLPSTSPANASCSLDCLVDAWRILLSN